MFCTACNFDLRGLPASRCPECGRAFNAADATTFFERPRSAFARLLPRILLTIGLLAILGIAIGGYTVYLAIHNAFEAEERLQTSRIVCNLIAEHVEQTPDHSWPTSWADLESRTTQGGESINNWPGGAARVRSLVKVDFTTNIARVLKQTPTTCTAITVTPGPNYTGIPGRWLYDLYDRLRDAIAQAPVPPAPSPDD